MFSPGSEKNFLRPESCSPSRNAPTRFPTGIPQMGEENQQISKIQLAVQKYNSNSLSNSRSGFLSPARHCLLKNTLRNKNYETEEGLNKNEKKSGNYYEGVGAFPTIHLRKSAIRYRPIKKLRDVKVPYPELPVNRYLSHLPELCTDLKSSTRSVLDVLQDLSAKKIQDEDDGNKTKSKGLAGDYIMDPNAVYKPLFVQKPKINSVTTRDSMTQTSSPFRNDTPSPQICNLNSRNDASDPKAELRKKLAKQNNEIFASLSSSVTSSFAIKRKIDKLTAVRDDDQSPDVSAVKKSKIDHIHTTENGFAKSVNKKTEPVKPSRKLKLIEASSPPPNKDRLTTIFLDIQSTSPKSKIFQDSSPNLSKSNGVSNGFGSNSPSVNGSVEMKVPKEPVNADSGKKESEQSKPMFSFPVNNPDTNYSISSAPANQFSLSENVSFNFKPTGSPLTPSSYSTGVSPTKDLIGSEKKDEAPKTSAFGSNGSFSGFKFGIDTTKSVEEKPETLGAAATTPATSPQFTFGVKSSDPTPEGSDTKAQSSLTSPGTPFTFGTAETPKTAASLSPPSITQNIQPGMFTFGQKPTPESPAQTSTTTSTTTSATTSTSSTTQAPGQSSVVVSSAAPTGETFSFGSKAETSTSPATSTAEQKPSFTFTFGQKSEPLKAPEVEQKNLFTFGQTSTQETTQNGAVTSQASNFGQSSVSFGGFGTPAINVTSSASLQPAFGVSTTQAPVLGTTVPSSPAFSVTTTATPTFGATSTTGTLAFGTSTTAIPAFGATSTTATPVFGASTTPSILSTTTSTTPTFGTSAATSPAFGTTTSAFGTSATQSTFKFGASTTQTNFSSHDTLTTTQSTFGLNTSQSAPAFGASPSVQSTTVFGTATTTPTPTFGVTSAPSTFGASTIAAGFGTSTTSPLFGTSSSNVTLPTFGTPTTQNAFGASTTETTSQSVPAFGISPVTGFGVPSTVQSTSNFGSSAAKSSAFGAPVTNGFGTTQPSSIFGTPTTAQSGFGATANTAFGTTSAFGSTSQSNPAFDTSTETQTTSAFGAQPFGKPSATTVFGQSSAGPFPAGNNFASVQTNFFGAKTNDLAQNKMFGIQNNVKFGSTANSTGFTTSPQTAATVFSFGGGGNNSFSITTNVSAESSKTQTSFAFTPNEPFKFGASATKENPAFGASPNFNFGNQVSSAAPSTSFNFGQTQNPSATGFNFSAGSSSTPSVFSFGSSGSSSSGSSSNRGFNFGTPTPGAPFGQSTPTFGVPGTFSIGSGSSQSRPRAASRLRRRP